MAITDPRELAASAVAGALDGSNADALAELGQAGRRRGRRRTARWWSGSASPAQTAQRRADIQTRVTGDMDALRAADAGVNLDEEMTNMLTYQRAYEAASRVLTTVDEMLDTLINRTGLVGR